MWGAGRNFVAPLLVSLGVGILPSTETLNIFLRKKKLLSLFRLIENFNTENLHSNRGRNIVSKALSIFRNTAAIDMVLLKLNVMWFVSLIHLSVVLWRARKPNWHPLSRPLSSICLWTIFRIRFLNSLPVVDKRLIGLIFWGNLVS
jgi:hypothetical protein